MAEFRENSSSVNTHVGERGPKPGIVFQMETRLASCHGIIYLIIILKLQVINNQQDDM